METQYREVIRTKIADSIAVPIPEFTRRDFRLPSISRKAVAVVGMRRTGKTTYLWQILADRLAAGTPRQGLLHLNFEDERLAGMTGAHLGLVTDEYYKMFPDWRTSRRLTLLLDEIQNVPGWEVYCRRILDTENIDLFLSGSSARLLSREVATSMRGRAMEVMVYPFSFREYLRHAGSEPSGSPRRFPSALRSALRKRLGEYLNEGGFPEAQGAAQRDRHDLLRGYVDAALLRDVIERHGVTHPVALRWMVRHLLGNAAGTFSVNRFHTDLRSQGFQLAKDTLHAYLAHLEDAFLVRTAWLATASERRRMVNPRKVYPIDPSIIPVFDRTARANTGHALETCVMLELERRGAELAYVKTENGCEVDFLARYADGHEELVQVCADLGADATRERELRAFSDAAQTFPRAEKTLICLDCAPSAAIPGDIAVWPAEVWLLNDQ